MDFFRLPSLSKTQFALVASVIFLIGLTATGTLGNTVGTVTSGNFSFSSEYLTGLATTQTQVETTETDTVNLQRGLQGYWRFDDPEVSRGYSLEYDGSDDYIDMNGSENIAMPSGSSSRTVTAWVRMDTCDDAITHILHYGQDSNNQSWGLAVDCSSNNLIAHEWGFYGGAGNVPTDKWGHLAISMNSSGYKKHYIDGNMVGTDTHLPDTTLTRTPKIGARVSPNEYWNGRISAVRVYNRTLSSSEIQNIYKNQESIREGLLLHFNFNKGPESCNIATNKECLRDKTEYKNNGTPMGFIDNEFGTGSGWVNQTPINRPVLKDYSVNNYKGTFYGGNDGKLNNFGYNSSSGWKTGNIGEYALKFDGKNDYVSVSSSDIRKIEEEITISSWIYIPSLSTCPPSSESYCGVLTGVSGGNKYDNRILINSNGEILTQFSMNGTSDNFYSSGTISPNQWNHIVYKYDGSSEKYFINGEPDASKAESGDIDTGNSNMVFGRGYPSSPYYSFNGTIDDIRMYDEALSKSEIKSLYEKEPISDGLVGRWNFEAGDRETAYDTSNFRKDGFLDTTAIDFDGTDDYVKTSSAFSYDSFTLSAWVKRDNNPGWGGIITNDGSGSYARNWWFGGWNGNNCIHFYVDPVNSTYENNQGPPCADGSLSLNDWHHVAGVHTGDFGKMRVYIDGRIVAKKNFSGPVTKAPDTLVDIGGDRLSNNWFNGSVDEVRVYNRSLSKEEVQRLAFR